MSMTLYSTCEKSEKHCSCSKACGTNLKSLSFQYSLCPFI
uniref:Uncharacterized protein n=1 Tax=Arundo donax TaxID=35708 RepID=A0A0A9FJB0_ARUDO